MEQVMGIWGQAGINDHKPKLIKRDWTILLKGS
jgi:hypothetical protein